MNENRIKRNQLLGGRIVQGLKSRNMDGYYAETKGSSRCKNETGIRL